MLDLGKLREFYYVAKFGGFAKASKESGLNSSYLLRQVHSFEESFGSKLFYRHFRGMSLTEEGKKLYALACKIIKDVEHFEQDYPENILKKKKLSLGISTGLATDWLLKFLPNFINQNEELHLEIKIFSYAIDFDKVDIGICQKIGSPILEEHFLRDFEFRLYCSQEYIEKYGKPNSYIELDKHRTIDFSGGEIMLFMETDNLFSKENKKLGNTVLTVNSPIVEGMMAAMGIGIASLWTESPYVKNFNMIDIFPREDSVNIQIFFSYKKENTNPLIKEFYNFLKKMI